MAIHPSAVIDSKAQIDPSVEIGPHCVIDANVSIAAGCRLYQGVFLTGWTEIGEGCVLHPGAIVGHEPQDTDYQGERTICRIGRRTILREYVTIHRATGEGNETVVGEDCFFLAGSHVAHNCSVGSHVTLVNHALLGGHVHLADRVTLGGGAMVHQFVRVGELSMIAGLARVRQDVPPFAMVDSEGQVAGLNRVGLRRAGFSRETVRAIREAYRTLYAAGEGAGSLIPRLEATLGDGPERRLFEFVRSGSKRGLAGRSVRSEVPPIGESRVREPDAP